VPVKAQPSTVKLIAAPVCPRGLAGAINATLSPGRHVPAEEGHALQRCDSRIEGLGAATNACSNSTAHSWRRQENWGVSAHP
jgi:hypothetical protein